MSAGMSRASLYWCDRADPCGGADGCAAFAHGQRQRVIRFLLRAFPPLRFISDKLSAGRFAS
jgi:hypothetical protein